MGVAPVGGTSQTPPATDATSADAAVQEAFSTAIIKASLFLLEGTVGDIAEACNDTTSNPDAVG